MEYASTSSLAAELQEVLGPIVLMQDKVMVPKAMRPEVPLDPEPSPFKGGCPPIPNGTWYTDGSSQGWPINRIPSGPGNTYVPNLYGRPLAIETDRGTPFTGQRIQQWAQQMDRKVPEGRETERLWPWTLQALHCQWLAILASCGEGLQYDLHVTPWVFNTWPLWLTAHRGMAKERTLLWETYALSVWLIMSSPMTLAQIQDPNEPWGAEKV
ncbi:hypothetical protein AAY473_004956 [Plecturocebus cupreus]